MTKNLQTLPVLPLRDPDLVVMPGLFCDIIVGRPFSINAINSAFQDKTDMIIAMQQDPMVNDPSAKDFHSTCTVAEIRGIVPVDEGEVERFRVIVIGKCRAKLKRIGMRKEGHFSYMYGEVKTLEEPDFEVDDHLKELAAQLKDSVTEHLHMVTVEDAPVPDKSDALSLFVDNIIGQLPVEGNKKREFLRERDPRKRLQKAVELTAELAKLSSVTITAEPPDDQEDLVSLIGSEVRKIAEAVEKVGLPEDALKVARRELRRLQMMFPNSSEFQVTFNYLESLTSLPWNYRTEDKLDIDEAREILDRDHYGLKKAKERIIEWLSVKKLAPENKGSIICFVGPPGTGKAQPLDAKILTPNGFVNMESLRVGDKVLTPGGEVSRVTAIFPQGYKNIYRVKLSDGSSTECCDEHLWKVQTRDDRKLGRSRVVQLKDIRRNFILEKGKRKNYSIPSVGKLDINVNQTVPIDPYLVGIFISEGYGKGTSISNVDPSIISEINECVNPINCRLKHRSGYDYKIIKDHHNPADNINKKSNKSSFTKFLDDYNLRECLSDTKFIPELYLLSSFKNREALLQGILDGARSAVNNSCSIEWSSASKKLALDLRFLVHSLGGQARYSVDKSFYTYKGQKLDGKWRHRLRIVLPETVIPFRSNRKMGIYTKTLKRKRFLPRYIEEISLIGSKRAQCILIDHPDHLYVTDDFIVTHNTTLGRSIAKATGRKFVRMSLGGVNDEAEIRGHRKTYVGAMSGRIIQNIRQCGSKNPVYVLDEIDKIHRNFRGDPSSALLEVLDPEQNSAFNDHYLGTPFDLSEIIFIVTANEVSPIPPALKDRLEIIEISGYSTFDKAKIAQKHLVPKKKDENGLKDVDISISNNAINKIIGEYTSEPGVRNLERLCGTVMRKMAVKVAKGKTPCPVVKVDMIPKLLGPPKVFIEKANEKPAVGVSTGLAWSFSGGSLLFVESLLTTGEGKVKLTGNLGKVLEESGNAVVTWIKAHHELLKVELDKLENFDIHVHFPAGATPKDGPSAGIAIAASVLSLLVNRPVRSDVAMTGEISLRGNIMPIGGLKEKVLAAHRAGIKEVLYPEQNEHDIEDIPNDVKETVKLTPVSNLAEALKMLIIDSADDDSTNNVTSGNDTEPMMNLGA